MSILNNRYKEALQRSSHNEAGELQRYLFLDIDGVLNTVHYSDYLIDHNEDECDEDGAIFDPEAIDNLATIIRHVPDLKIIITSTWRFKGLDWMNRLWEKRKMPGRIFSFTPALDIVCFKDLINQKNSNSTFPYGTRGLEINEWLRQNVKRGTPYKYIILDDEIDYLAIQEDSVVLTDPYQGLSKSKAEEVIQKLSIPNYPFSTNTR